MNIAIFVEDRASLRIASIPFSLFTYVHDWCQLSNLLNRELKGMKCAAVTVI